MSVTKPYLYSCLLKSSAVLISVLLNSIIFRPDALNLVQAPRRRSLRSQQLRKRDSAERVVDDLVQLDDHRANAAVAGVNARIENARVALAMRLGRFAFENAYHLVQRISDAGRERVAALDAARRLHQSGLAQNPHQLAGVRVEIPSRRASCESVSDSPIVPRGLTATSTAGHILLELKSSLRV
jgi:hypothetical protein